MTECIFCKIRDKEIPKELEYEDDDIMVFPDINPMKPIHMLVIPKKHIEDFLELTDEKLMVKFKKVLDNVIKKKLKGEGFRVSINGGGAQYVKHLHFHVIGPIDKATEL